MNSPMSSATMDRVTTKINPLDHMKLVYKVVNKPKMKWHVDRIGGEQDAKQAGFIGLMIAADSYDPATAKHSWSNHACRNIEWELMRRAADSSFVKIPPNHSHRPKGCTEERQKAIERARIGLIGVLDEPLVIRYAECHRDWTPSYDDHQDPNKAIVEELLSRIKPAESEAIRVHFGIDRPQMWDSERSAAEGIPETTIFGRWSRGIAKLKKIAKTRGLQPCPT